MNSLMRRVYRLPLRHRYLEKAYCSTVVAGASASNAVEKTNFEDFIRQRQTQATRSVVVQVSSEKSFPELYNYCSAYGTIVDAQHYCIRHDDVQHYILLEYEETQQADAAIDSSAYNEELTGVPVRSPFLWFRASGKRALKTHDDGLKKRTLSTVDGALILDSAELESVLKDAENIEQQLTLLYQYTKLNDLGFRLRFLAALQVQQAVLGMFPAANALPFGSSVNGFGKMGCDLDLILRFDEEYKGQQVRKNSTSRLVFHTKENLTNGRSQTQRQMESIGDMLQLFLPGVCHVRRILQARVPIIKYHQEHLNLEVDLSMSNLSGFYMSELLYMFGEFDHRVRPLIFCIRRWASACGLTNPSPGRWITNFSLTCLVIFFLQQTKQPVLPSINALVKLATPQDICITEDGINCTFARNLHNIDFHSHNTCRMSQLLLQFFEFYSQFDFQNRGISLNEGRIIAKPDHSALYIVNPLEQMLNVSKNVSLEECERLRIEVRNAAWILESEVENQRQLETDKANGTWGLLSLFKTPEKTIIRPNMFFKPRILEVSELFDKVEVKSSVAMSLKNSEVKQQIQNIKATGRSDIKQMRLNATSSSASAKSDNTSGKGRRNR